MAEKSVSKSKLKAKALEYFRQVEQSGEALIVTDRGKPVLKIVPYRETTADALGELRGSVLRYDDPTEPVGVDDWDFPSRDPADRMIVAPALGLGARVVTRDRRIADYLRVESIW